MTVEPILRMRRCLAGDLPPPLWPVGTRLAAFDPALHPAPVHALLVRAFAGGGGSVAPFGKWWADLTADREYDPALCFLAMSAEGRIIGVAQCWTSAFVKDLAVEPAWQRRGVGEALLFHAFATFRKRGAPAVDLKVLADNPSGAVRLYERVGMTILD